jgi:hypothetical protein
MVLAGMLPTMAISYDPGLSEDSVTMPIVVLPLLAFPTQARILCLDSL